MTRSKLELTMGVLDTLSRTDMNSLESIPLIDGVTRDDMKGIVDGLEAHGFVQKLLSLRRRRQFYGLTDRGLEVLRLWMRLNNELIGLMPLVSSLPDEIHADARAIRRPSQCSR